MLDIDRFNYPVRAPDRDFGFRNGSPKKLGLLHRNGSAIGQMNLKRLKWSPLL